MIDLRRHWPELALLLLTAGLLFSGLGSHGIHNADEARYYIVVDEMMEAGRFDDFTLRGEPYFNKGPLRIGMTHLLARAFGLSPWTHRIPSAVMGLVCVALVYLLGRRFWGTGPARWAALVFATGTQWLYIHGARSGEMESTLIAAWLGALLLATLARDRSSTLWWCAVVVGLGGLVKHLAYIAPIGATVLLWWIMSGDWRVIGVRRIVGAGLLAVAVPVPWHAMQIARHGMDFVNGYLGREVVERVSRDYKGSYGWAFYLSVIKDGMFPWSLALPFALYRAVRSQLQGPTRFLVVLGTLMIGGLLLTQGDLSWYVMPVLPLLSLLVGRWIAESTPGRPFTVVWGSIAIALALSPSNVMTWDVHRRFAIEGLIGSNLAGVLQGAAAWWPQVVAAVLMLGAVAIAGRKPAGRTLTLGAFVIFAAIHAALPLRTAFTRADLDLLADELARQPGIEAGVTWVAPGAGREESGFGVDGSVSWVFLERAADDVNVVESVDSRDPWRWCVVREQDLGEFEPGSGTLERGIWIAIPPDPK